MGTNMLGAFILFGGFGFYMDSKYETGYAFTLGGLLLAITVCGYEVWKLVRRMDEDERRSKEDKQI